MENQNSSYSVQIGKTTFIVCVKQSETAKKPIEKMFKDMCRHEVTRDFLADNLIIWTARGSRLTWNSRRDVFSGRETGISR